MNYYNSIVMIKNGYKKKKRETFGQKIVNFVLTIVLACAISSQVCTAANNNLRFAQVSDVHYSSFEENTSYKFLKKSGDLFDDVIFQLNTSGPYEFVIFTGDLVNKPIKSELVKFIDKAKTLHYRWYAINGNHDIAIGGELSKKEFFKTLSENNNNMNNKNSYYSFTPKRGYRVLCLDSIIDSRLTSNGEFSEEEIAWIKSEFDKHPKDVMILCTHVPIFEPFSSPNHKLNNESTVKKIFRNYSNPIIILQGHYHCVKAKQFDNIVYISCPSLVTYPNAYRVVNINSNKKRVVVDVFLKETNLKDIQSRSKLRMIGIDTMYGTEKDRNVTFTINKQK